MSTKRDEVIATMTRAKQKMAEVKAEYLDEIKASYFELVKDLFEKYPVIETISWQQYTQYFNDGEECSFNAHIDDFVVNDEYKYKSDMTSQEREMYITIEEYLNNFSEEDYKEMFGDHVSVTLTKSEIIISRYDDHD